MKFDECKVGDEKEGSWRRRNLPVRAEWQVGELSDGEGVDQDGAVKDERQRLHLVLVRGPRARDPQRRQGGEAFFHLKRSSKCIPENWPQNVHSLAPS